jgi:hypothetical protein
MDETPKHKDGEEAALLAIGFAAWFVVNVRLHPSMLASPAVSEVITAIAEKFVSRTASMRVVCVDEFIRDLAPSA